jgi:hypothetical protein
MKNKEHTNMREITKQKQKDKSLDHDAVPHP